MSDIAWYPCPHCTASISTVARICSHCFATLVPPPVESSSPASTSTVDFRIRRMAQQAGSILPMVCEIDDTQSFVLMAGEEKVVPLTTGPHQLVVSCTPLNGEKLTSRSSFSHSRESQVALLRLVDGTVECAIDSLDASDSRQRTLQAEAGHQDGAEGFFLLVIGAAIAIFTIYNVVSTDRDLREFEADMARTQRQSEIESQRSARDRENAARNARVSCAQEKIVGGSQRAYDDCMRRARGF